MRRSRTPWVAGVLAVLLAALTLDVLRRGPTHRLDWRVHVQIHEHVPYGSAWRVTAAALALAGQRWIVAVALLVFGILAARRHGNLRPVVKVGGVLVGLALGVLLLKFWIGRTAPTSGHDALHAGGVSYPAGHAVNAIVGWRLVLEYAASLGGRLERILSLRRRRVATALLAAAAGVGMLGQDYHWTTDVIAGWILGALILLVVLAVGPIKPVLAEVTPAAAPAPVRPSPSA